VAVERFSISTSEELFEALETLRQQRDQQRSDLVEMLLREHPMVRREIRRARREARTKRGRDPAELSALARSARRQWDKREAAGEVSFLDR
jgi:hypothetical protein